MLRRPRRTRRRVRPVDVAQDAVRAVVVLERLRARGRRRPRRPVWRAAADGGSIDRRADGDGRVGRARADRAFAIGERVRKRAAYVLTRGFARCRLVVDGHVQRERKHRGRVRAPRRRARCSQPAPSWSSRRRCARVPSRHQRGIRRSEPRGSNLFHVIHAPARCRMGRWKRVLLASRATRVAGLRRAPSARRRARREAA